MRVGACSSRSITGDLQKILEALRRHDLPFLQLRPRRMDGDEVHEGDFDFLIDRRAREAFVRRMMALLAERRRFFLMNSPVRAAGHKTVFLVHDPSANAFVTVEFWHEAVFRTGSLRGGLRWEDLQGAIEPAEAGGWRLHPDVEALLFLTHLHAKGKLPASPLVAERLDHYRRAASSADVVALLAAVVGGGVGFEQASDQALGLLKRRVGVRPMRSVARVALRQVQADAPRRLVHRAMRRVIALQGPDGSGKTTLADALARHAAPGTVRRRVFKDYFRNRALYQAARRLRKRLRAHEPRNIWEERIGGWLALLALPVHAWNLIRCRARGQTLLIDRYFHDYLMLGVRRAQPASRGSRPWRTALLPLVPRPGLVINPLAEHASTTHREGALSEQGFAEYERQLLDLVARRPPEWFAHIPASHGLDRCVDYALTAAARAGVGYRALRPGFAAARPPAAAEALSPAMSAA